MTRHCRHRWRPAITVLALLAGLMAAGGCATLRNVKRTLVVAALFNRAYDSLQSGDEDETEKRLRRVLALAPNHPEANTLLGLIYARRDRHQLAARCLRRVPANQRPLIAWLTLADSYDHMEQPAAAEASYREALQHYPDNADALNALGYYLAEHRIHLDEAVELTRRAVKKAPKAGYIVDSLGWALFQRGDTKEAVNTLRRAVRLEPDHQELRYHLGEALRASGSKAAAIEQFAAGLRMAPADKQIRDALRQLGQDPEELLQQPQPKPRGWRRFFNASS